MTFRRSPRSTGAVRLGYSAAQIRAAEGPLIAAGVPLMRRAAAGLAAEIRRMLGPSPRVVLLVGSGDNGSDALYAGAELAAEGVDVVMVPTGSRTHEGGTAAAVEAGVRLGDAKDAAELATGADVVVDGILGIGAGPNPALRGTARDIVESLLPVLQPESRPLVVAVDLPSGVGPDDGAADGVVLPADVTVTFGAEKAGLLVGPGAALAGRVVLVDIGLALEGVEPLVRLD